MKNSFDSERHTGGVNVVVVGGGGQHGLENDLMVFFYLNIYCLYCSVEADCYVSLLFPAPMQLHRHAN